MKLQRNYELTIALEAVALWAGTPTPLPAATINTVVITPPFTLNFDIQKQTEADIQSGTFTIYNLKETLRRQLYKDVFNTTQYRALIFKAGYGDDLPVVFQGNIQQCYSVRQGTEWKTTITAYDGGSARFNGFSSVSMPAQTSFRDILTEVARGMPNMMGINIGGIDGQSERGYANQGNSWDLITEMVKDVEGQNAHSYIDGEQIHIYKLNEYVEGGIQLINADTGLLDTPQRYQQFMKIRMIFEPHIKLNQQVQVASRESIYSGYYLVKGFAHQGTISEAEGGQCVTNVNLYVGADYLKVRNFQGIPYRMYTNEELI